MPLERSYPSYLAQVLEAQREYPGWRIGQAYYNVLDAVDPDLAASIRGGALDPYYDNSRISEFCQEVARCWA